MNENITTAIFNDKDVFWYFYNFCVCLWVCNINTGNFLFYVCKILNGCGRNGDGDGDGEGEGEGDIFCK